MDLRIICLLDCDRSTHATEVTFRRSDECLEFGPLLQAIWADDLNITLTFTNSIRANPSGSWGPPGSFRSFVLGSQQHTPVPPETNGCDAVRLTHMVQALCKDKLGVKKFRHAIGNIGIRRNGMTGIVALWTPKWESRHVPVWRDSSPGRHPYLEHAKYFKVGANGQLGFQQESPTHLLTLPEQLRRRIMKAVVDKNEDCELDLDTWTNMQDRFGILKANRFLHETHLHSTLKATTFALSMLATDAHATFDHFDKLRRLLRTKFRQSRPAFGIFAKYHIDLHFRLGRPTSLDNLRINIMPLAVATYPVPGDRTITIKLQAPNHNRRVNITVERSFTVRKLRRIVLDALEQFVRIDCPDWRARCPQIWINGRGQVTNVVPTGREGNWNGQDPAELYPRLWSAAGWGFVGGSAPPPTDVDGLARNVFLYMKWASL